MISHSQEGWIVIQNPGQSQRHESDSLQHTDMLTEANVKALDDQKSVLDEEIQTQAQTKTVKTNAPSNINTLSQAMTKHLEINPRGQASVFDHSIKQKIKSIKPHDQDAITVLTKTIENVRSTGGNILNKQRQGPPEPTFKDNQALQKLLDREMNATSDIFKTMNVDSIKKDGKRLFTDKVNISNPENMHTIEKDQQILAQYNVNKMLNDYPDKSKIQYVQPEIKKEKLKHNFVHNILAAKSKTNNAHLEKIVDSSIFNSNKYQILQQLHEEQIEFRIMT